MTNTTQPIVSPAHANAASMRNEIRRRWAKLSDQEIAAIKSNDDWVAQIQSKYQLQKSLQEAKKVQSDYDDDGNSSHPQNDIAHCSSPYVFDHRVRGSP